MANQEANAIDRMLEGKRIAVVGLSDDPSRPSFGVAAYMMQKGYEIIPVNPNCKTVLGLNAVAALDQVEGTIDVVNVFRRSEACEQVAMDAIAVGAKGIWLQSGIRNEQARQLAEQAGLDFVENRCIMVEKMRRG